MQDRDPSVERLFDRLATDVLEATADPSGAADQESRLWNLANTLPRFHLRAITPQERAQAAEYTARLRSRAAELIATLPRTQAEKRELAERIRESARTFDLRPWRSDDLDVYRRLLSDEELWTFLPEDFPGELDEEAALGLIAHSNEAPHRHEVFAVEHDGRVVGQVRLQFDSDPHPDTAEISYWIGREHWGRGFASAIVRLFTFESFRAHEDVDRIFARVLQGNDGSLKVLERGRYRYETYRPRAIEKGGEPLGEHVLSVFRSDYPLGTPELIVEPDRAGRSSD